MSSKRGPKGIDWDAQPLGEKPDQEIADLLGCSRAAVSTARRKRGVPRCPAQGRKGRAWDEIPLGEKPDPVIAKELGCTRAAVAWARKARGIKSYRQQQREAREDAA